MSIHCLIKITCIRNHISGLCLFKINACYHIENWGKFNCLLVSFLEDLPNFSCLIAIILILSLQTKDLQNAICLKERLNWSLNCSTNLIGEGQTRMIKRPSKKKIQLRYRIFIYYSAFEPFIIIFLWTISMTFHIFKKNTSRRYSFDTNLEIGHSLFIQINRSCTECYTRENKSFFLDDVTLNKNV